MKSKLFFLLFLSSCVTIAPRRNDSDYYHEQKFYLNKSSKYGTKYLEIDANDIKAKHFSKVYLFATWCSHCISDMKSTKKGENPDIFYVSANYNIESIERLFAENFDTIYILKNSKYGSNEKEKIRRFALEMTGKVDSLYATPKRFERDQIGQYKPVNHF